MRDVDRKRRGVWRVATAAVVAMAAIAFLGAAFAPPPSRVGDSASGPPWVGIGADGSASNTPDERKQQSGVILQTVEDHLADGALVRFALFATRVRTLYQGCPRGAADLLGALEEWQRTQVPGSGTLPEVYLRELDPPARQAAEEKRPLAIILAWDGECVDAKTLTAAATELAGIPGMRACWILGGSGLDQSGLRDRAEKCFAAFGRRLIVSGSHDLGQGLDDFGRRLRGER